MEKSSRARGIDVRVQRSADACVLVGGGHEQRPRRGRIAVRAGALSTVSESVVFPLHGSDTVQLLSRHWTITDATGHAEEIKGPGVVGEQPVLAPGESFHYTSGCPLKTSTGVMRGTYQMVDEDGGYFDVEIAPFALHEPYTVH